ncbi:Uncharacterised protein [Vibrio cholerae]|nr:Uncharacterised protein [Vibrio cholerae]
MKNCLLKRVANLVGDRLYPRSQWTHLFLA